MSDLYRDSEQRYLNDPEFHALVDVLFHHAIQHGLTPGELKQIAFFAALKAEQYATRNVTKVGSNTFVEPSPGDYLRVKENQRPFGQ